MSATELRAHLAALDLSQSAFARLAGCTDRQVRRWAAGEAAVPRWAALLLRLMALPGGLQLARGL